MIRIRSPQDLGAGIVLALIGVVGLYFGRELTFGGAAKMGPGFFPTILSWLIVGFGVLLAGRSLTLDGPEIEAVQVRPLLFVVLAIIAFALLIEQVGLAITVAVVVALAALARRAVNPLETAALAVGLALFAVAVFVYALGQPVPAWWGR